MYITKFNFSDVHFLIWSNLIAINEEKTTPSYLSVVQIIVPYSI